MNLYDALKSGDVLLEKEIKKLVDSTIAEADRRAKLIEVIRTRFDKSQELKEAHLYGSLAADPKASTRMDEFRRRAASIRGRIHELERLGKDADGVFQTATEVLYGEFEDLMKWENAEVFPCVRRMISDEEAEELGSQIREEEKRLFAQQA